MPMWISTRSNALQVGFIAVLMASALGCGTSQSGSMPISPPPSPAIALSFSDFFVLPVGPRGLEPTAKLKTLNGQRVRIEGYMANEEEPYPGLFMLTPVPVALAERADGPADYLPPSTLYVHLPESHRDVTLPHRREVLSLTGRLDLGAREEVNGRFSTVRLELDELPGFPIPSDRNTENNKGEIE